MNQAAFQLDADSPLPDVHDDYVQTQAGEAVFVYPLGVEVDLALRGWELTLLNNPQGGTATVTADGAVKFAPEPGFIGAATIHFLFEDQQHNDVSATVTVEVQNHFAFETASSFGSAPTRPDQSDDTAATLAQKVFTVVADPVFAGSAVPNARLFGRIYQQCGALAVESAAVADQNGQWNMPFPDARAMEFYRLEIEQLGIANNTVGKITLHANDACWQPI